VANKRRYNTRLIKATWPYDVPEIAALLGIHKNAVLRWLKEGLQADTTRRPYLIRGEELARFLAARQKSKKRKCGLSEFFCFRCRAPRGSVNGIANLTVESPTRFRLKGRCVVCGTSVNKVQGIKNLLKIEACLHIEQREGWHLIEGSNPSVNSDRRQEK